MSRTPIPPAPAPIPRMLGVDSYRRPAPLTPVDMVLDGNEGIGPPDRVVNHLTQLQPEDLRRYPSTAQLTAKLATRMAVDNESVLLTAGADEGLDRVCRTYLDASRNCVLPSPTFVMLPRYVQLAAADLRCVEWSSDPFPVDRVVECADESTGVVFVVSPNNPTGLTARAHEIRELAQRLPTSIIVWDAAYIEFDSAGLVAADAAIRPLLACPNVLIARTLSKAWGLAGLRIGYLVGAPTVINQLRAAGSPYAVAAPSVAIALRWLDQGEAHAAAFVDRIAQERRDLSRWLVRLGCDVWPSAANFLLVRSKQLDPHALENGLRGLGIAVRAFPAEPLLEGCVRITLPGRRTEFRRLRRALGTTLAPRFLVLDRSSTKHRSLLCGTPWDSLITTDSLDQHRTWVITSCADQVVRAREQGALPIGITTAEDCADTLLRAGAARVVPSFEFLSSLPSP